MSTSRLGEKLREIRLQQKLPLRKVASQIDLDVAILSKMERGERRFTKAIVEKLAGHYQHDVDELMVLFLSEKILYDLGNESLAMEALKVAESQIQYQAHKPPAEKSKTREEIILKMKEYFQSQALVSRAWIFGSFARGDDGPASDIDVMIDVPFETSFTFFDLGDIQDHLEKLTLKKVDVVMLNGVKPEMKKRILNDQILIYEA